MNELAKASVAFATMVFLSLAVSVVYDAIFDHLPEWYALAPFVFIGLSLLFALIVLITSFFHKTKN